ncbi:MAG: hypothetical protein RL754_1410 [Bacteroidota bacterium]|jgi:L-asparaginase
MKKIALIYTGGTIGMQRNEQGKLAPVNFDALRQHIPSLELLPVELDVQTVEKPIDSSDMQPSYWVDLVERIERGYSMYDGFVVLHGTDTMAFTASALSFMLRGLDKPVIMTGSQLPVGVLRTDAVENLLSAIEFAALEGPDGQPIIREVAVYFEYKLYRGNRVYKRSSNEFDAFSSPNYPPLAESGVNITVNNDLLLEPHAPLTVHKQLGTGVGVITLYPGLDYSSLPVLDHWRVLLIRTFGAGNVPSSAEFESYLQRLGKNGTIIVNTSQCVSGSVRPGLYHSSLEGRGYKVLSAKDMTFESAIVKAMVLLGEVLSADEFDVKFTASLCGELTD